MYQFYKYVFFISVGKISSKISASVITFVSILRWIIIFNMEMFLKRFSLLSIIFLGIITKNDTIHLLITGYTKIHFLLFALLNNNY